VVLVLAAEVGLAPVLDRFAKDPLADARWSIFGSSMDGIGSFFPLGAGAGTYPHLYPAFQPVELGRHFVNHAHNDFIEALFEAGLPVLLLMAFGVFLYFRQWLRVWVGGKWGEFRFIQVGAGIGLLLILLHSLVDFNMQIPANALFAAFLLAVFMKPYKEQFRGRRGSRKPTRVMEQAGSARDDADAEAAVKENTPPAPAPVAPPAEPLADEDNPFLKSS